MLLAAWSAAVAAPIKNAPVRLVQPSGDTIDCFVSGDEFFRWLHDADGYVIVQDRDSGYYWYAVKDAEGHYVPSAYRPGRDNPRTARLTPNLKPCKCDIRKGHQTFDIPESYRRTPAKTSGRNHGTLNNLVVFIRFSDDTACTATPFSTINARFNDTTAGANSVCNYFRHTSYGNLTLNTHFFPAPQNNVVLSYQDSHPRAYYQKASPTNPIGYDDESDTARRNREFALLRNALAYVNSNSPVPSSLDIDFDNDGFVDNVVFVTSGACNDWNDLLWPHKWAIYLAPYPYINGKQVYTFNLMQVDGGDHYFGTSTLCHEMSHTLGNPDLYHYYHYDEVSPAGSWDLMCNNSTPPQQSNSSLKCLYLNWIDNIEEVNHPGHYSLQSLGSGSNNAIAIASPDSDQYYVLEYRNTADTFDSSIPNRGLLVWRLNLAYEADNPDFDYYSTPHHLWLFRPGSTCDTVNGSVAQAAFGVGGRNRFPSLSDPTSYPYLCDGTRDTSFVLSNIIISPDQSSVSFDLTFNRPGIVHDTVYHLVHDTVYRTEYDTIYRYATDTVVNRITDTVYVAVPDTQYVSYPTWQVLVSSADPWMGMTSGSGRYPQTSVVEIAALPIVGSDTSYYVFSHWQDGNTENPRRVEVTGDAMYVAYFDTVSSEKAAKALPPANTDIHDTVYIDIHDTVWITNRDTIFITFTDTVFIDLRDTVEQPVLIPVVLDTLHYGKILVLSGEKERGYVAGNGVFALGTEAEIGAAPYPGYRFIFWHDRVKDNPRRVVLTDSLKVFVAEFAPLEVKPDDPEPEEWEKRVDYRVQGLTLTVTCPASSLVRIFDLNGRPLAVSDPCGDTKTESVRPFQLPQSGVYLVQVGPFPVKKVLVY